MPGNKALCLTTFRQPLPHRLSKARVLYDFEGQEGTGELTIRADEIIAIIRQDVGDGWWEGTNSKGETGLFPEAYVEIASEVPPPAAPPPPLPEGYASTETTNGGGGSSWGEQSDWGSQTGGQTTAQPSGQSWGSQDTWSAQAQDSQAWSASQTSAGPPEQHQNQAYEVTDDWDDDWDDDSSNEQEHGGGDSGTTNLTSTNKDKSSLAVDAGVARQGTVRKSFNRFSTFVKSGGEAYILGTAKISAVPSETHKINVLVSEEGILFWEADPQPHTCSVDSPKKAHKLKGLKSYIVYQITPTFNNLQVSRRYKHFDWLHERLEEKFTVIPIPPLPDKQVTGRYAEEFIERRMQQLQLWVNRLTRHPVLSRCDVWRHFLTCTDDKRWKQGKRKAEKDELVGASFFLTINPPSNSLDVHSVETQMENFGKFVKGMDDSVKNLYMTAQDSMKKHIGPYKREFQKIGSVFKTLGTAFELDTGSYSQNLTLAIQHTSATYDEIGKLYEEQPKYDLLPMLDVLHEYRGMLTAFPDILQIPRGAVQKSKECQKLSEEGKMDAAEVQKVILRTDTVSAAMLAEINHFQQERVIDFKYMMQSFIQEQINFYQRIVAKLQESLDTYDAA